MADRRKQFSAVLCVALSLGWLGMTGCQRSDPLCADSCTEWEVLFDGSSLDAFRGYDKDHVPANWVIDPETKALHCHPDLGKSLDDGRHPDLWRSDLITRKAYGNFELVLEFKVGEACNSGIFYRAPLGKMAPWINGFEYQILDDTAEVFGVGADCNYACAALMICMHARTISHLSPWVSGTPRALLPTATSLNTG